MKKLLVLFFIFLFSTPVYAKQKISAPKNTDIIQGEVIEFDDSKNEEQTISPEEITKQDNILKGKISDYVTVEKGLVRLHYKEYARLDFGAIGNLNWIIDNPEHQLHTNYKFDSIDIILSGKINDYIDYTAQILPNRNINEQTILGDVWVRGKYKNYTAQVGRMRKPFAYEPTFSPYNQDFATKSQIARLFGDHRDTGAKFIANYKYVDIMTGLYASMQNRPFTLDEHGIEFDGTIVLKPLANFKDKGDLQLMGSIATGKRDYSYTNYSGLISYNYKKWGVKSEFISKEPTFYDEKKANGFYVDGTYFITDKLQALVRFDSYNPDVDNNSRRTNEYVAGLNYYLNNKNTMFVLNYAFIDGETNSQRISLQMRYRTW